MENVKHLSAKEIQGLMNHQLKTDVARSAIAVAMIAVVYTGLFWGFGKWIKSIDKSVEKDKAAKEAA